MDHILFQSWSGLGRVVIVRVAAYAALVLMLRVRGERSLAKLNAFDLIVTLALGSTLATTLLSKTVALAEGATAFAVLLTLQYAIAWAGTRSEHFQRLTGAAPTLLYHESTLTGPMHSARATIEDLAPDRTQERSRAVLDDACTDVVAGEVERREAEGVGDPADKVGQGGHRARSTVSSPPLWPKPGRSTATAELPPEVSHHWRHTLLPEGAVGHQQRPGPLLPTGQQGRIRPIDGHLSRTAPDSASSTTRSCPLRPGRHPLVRAALPGDRHGRCHAAGHVSWSGSGLQPPHPPTNQDDPV